MLPYLRKSLLANLVVSAVCCNSVLCIAQPQAATPDAHESSVVSSPHQTLAHAHNDYLHDRPLMDAVENGFASVEVDIFLQGDELLVGHDRWQLRAGRTIQSLYLDPLRRILKSNSGYIVRSKETFTLLVDIKTDGESTYERLHEVLRDYKSMLTEIRDGKVAEGPIEVIISGSRPIEQIAAQQVRWASVDGRIPDLQSDAPVHLMPLISDRWTKHFSWRGRGEFPADQRERLRNWVKTAHQQGRRVRFWATPESEAVWQQLADAKVDLINTDQLEKLSAFLSQRSEHTKQSGDKKRN